LERVLKGMGGALVDGVDGEETLDWVETHNGTIEEGGLNKFLSYKGVGGGGWAWRLEGGGTIMYGGGGAGGRCRSEDDSLSSEGWTNK
jgi:hypothetical protein